MQCTAHSIELSSVNIGARKQNTLLKVDCDQEGVPMLSSSELVLKTANHIEKNPRSYCYTTNRIPLCLNDTGCVLGWMAYFASEGDFGFLTPEVVARMTCDPVYACNIGYNDFFRRLDECYPVYRGHWRSEAKDAVAALRTYAAQYPEAPALPVWARMHDREAAAAKRGYARFRARLPLLEVSRAVFVENGRISHEL
jgi:hypothetical protein